MKAIKNFFNQQPFQFIWEKDDSRIEVTITLPNLEQCQWDNFCDWGPSYSVHLNPEDLPNIRYHNLENGKDEIFPIQLKKLAVHSPIDQGERKTMPFYLVFPDIHKGLVYFLYANRSGALCQIDIYSDDNDTKIYRRTMSPKSGSDHSPA